MSGVWIISENRRQALELLNIGRKLADKMGTRVFALLDGGGHGVAVAGLDLAGGHQVANKFINGFPAVRRFEFGHDLFTSQDVG